MNNVEQAGQQPADKTQGQISNNEHREYVILVTYNGVDKHIHYREAETIAAILQRAITAFGITQNAHVLALYTTAGAELNDAVTAESVNLPTQEVLLLRPSTVRGG